MYTFGLRIVQTNEISKKMFRGLATLNHLQLIIAYNCFAFHMAL